MPARNASAPKAKRPSPDSSSLFTDQELEALAHALNEQNKEMAVPDKKPSMAKKSGVSRDKLAGLPIEVVTCELDPQEVYDVCGSPLKKIGQKIVRSEVEYIKAQVRVRQHIQSVYKCTLCGSVGSKNPADHLISAAEERHKIVIFHYTTTRNGSHAKKLLKGWHGITQIYWQHPIGQQRERDSRIQRGRSEGMDRPTVLL